VEITINIETISVISLSKHLLQQAAICDHDAALFLLFESEMRATGCMYSNHRRWVGSLAIRRHCFALRWNSQLMRWAMFTQGLRDNRTCRRTC